MRTPFIISDSTPTFVLSGGIRAPRANVILKNPAVTAVEVLEFRFFYTTLGSGFLASSYNPVDLVRAKIKVNQRSVTNGKDVPVSLMCPLVDDGSYWSNYGTGQAGNASYTWKLTKPMYLPHNGQVTFDFVIADDFDPLQLYNNANIAQMQISVAMVCRSTQEAAPSKVCVPFATSWLTPVSLPDAAAVSASGGLLNFQSAVSDLRNGNKYAAHIEYLTASAMIGYGDNGARRAMRDGFGEVGGASPIVAASLMGYKYAGLRNGIRLQMRDTRGGFVVRDPTPLGLVVHPPSRAWKMNTIMAPDQYYIASFTGQWELDGGDATHTSQGFRLGLGLVGYHEVPLSDLGVFP